MKERWKRVWGNDEAVATAFLEEKGYSLNSKRLTWTHKNEEHTPTPKELDAVEYLKEQWGYGKIK